MCTRRSLPRRHGGGRGDEPRLLALLETIESTVDGKGSLLNLARVAAHLHAPRAKDYRVSFGLLSVDEYQRLLRRAAHARRASLAIPAADGRRALRVST